MLNKKTKISSLLLGTAFIGSAILAGCGTSSSNPTPGTSTPGKNNPQALYRETGGWTAPPQYQGNIFGAGGIGSAYGFTQIGLFQFVRSTDKVYLTGAASSVTDDQANTTTVKLRPNMKWSDGQPVTSQDVKAFYTLNDGVGLDKYLVSIDTPDDQTVVFHWTNPAPFDELKTLLLAQDWAFQIPYHVYKTYVDKAQQILDSASVDKTDPLGTYAFQKKLTDAQQKEWNDNWTAFTKDDPKLPIGAGPYTVQKVTQNQMVLVKNPNFYDASKVHFKKIILSNVPDLNQQYALLKAGQLDRYDGTQPKDILESILAANKNLVHYQMHDPACVGFIFNLTHKPFDNVVFREAIAYAVDRSKVREVGNYYGTTTDLSTTGIPTSVLPTYVPQDVQDKMTKFAYDPNKATQLLESIGWKKGSDGKWQDPSGKTPNFTIASDGGWVPAVNSGEVVAEQLTQFGLPTTYKAVDSSVYWTQVWQNNAAGDPYDMHFDWVDVTWGFNYPWSPLNNYWWNTIRQTGLPENKDTSVQATFTDWAGNKVDPYALLRQLPFMATDAQRNQAIAQMAYVANQGVYAINCFQNVTGTWYNMKTVGGVPWQSAIAQYNRDMPLPPADQAERIAETNEGFAGETWMIDGTYYPN